MGRPRKPVEEHVSSGNYRPSRHGPLPDPAPAPASPGGKPLTKPDSLGGRAAEVWGELTGLLGSALQPRDAVVLTELCRWVARSEGIAGQLDGEECGSAAFRSLMVSAGIATDKVALLCARCGLTPADEMKVRRKPPEAAKPKVATRPRAQAPPED